MAKEHHFLIEDAKQYGVESAVIIYNLRFWLDKNKANNHNIKDGRVWTYNTLKAWAELFPYYSQRQIERILKNMEKDGILMKGNYNKSKLERTTWYSLNLPEYVVSEKEGEAEKTALQPPSLPISPNGEMEITKRGNASHQTVKCSTDNNQQIKTSSKSVNNTRVTQKISINLESESFESKVMDELDKATNGRLANSKKHYAKLKIQEYRERFPQSESVADCWAYVVQAINHQYSLTAS